MHKVSVGQLTPGMRLGKALYAAGGATLLNKGVELSAAYIGAIRQRGFHYVYVLDGIADDVEPLGLISDRLRTGTVHNMQTMYDLMAAASQPVRDQVAADGAHVLREVPLQISSSVGKHLQALDRDVECLLDETLDSQTLAGIASLWQASRRSRATTTTPSSTGSTWPTTGSCSGGGCHSTALT